VAGEGVFDVHEQERAHGGAHDGHDGHDAHDAHDADDETGAP